MAFFGGCICCVLWSKIVLEAFEERVDVIFIFEVSCPLGLPCLCLSGSER